MKRVVIVLAVIALVAGLILAGVIAHDARLRSGARAEVRETTREEARKLVHLCELDGFANKIAMGTSHFFEYFHTDPEKARQVLHDIVMPVIETQELACASAKTEIEIVQRDAETPDRFIDASLPKVEANLATIAATRVAADALGAALVGPPDLAAWQQKLDALRAAAR